MATRRGETGDTHECSDKRRPRARDRRRAFGGGLRAGVVAEPDRRRAARQCRYLRDLLPRGGALRLCAAVRVCTAGGSTSSLTRCQTFVQAVARTPAARTQ